MRIFAIDPGQFESGIVIYDTDNFNLIRFGKISNTEVMAEIMHPFDFDFIAIEQFKSYGMPVGDSVFESLIWTGRFIQEAYRREIDHLLVPRKTVVTTVCNDPRAKDSNVRQAMIDYFSDKKRDCLGGGKNPVVGIKSNPGPLYGVSNDVWSALAIAVATDEILKFDKKRRGHVK